MPEAQDAPGETTGGSQGLKGGQLPPTCSVALSKAPTGAFVRVGCGNSGDCRSP